MKKTYKHQERIKQYKKQWRNSPTQDKRRNFNKKTNESHKNKGCEWRQQTMHETPKGRHQPASRIETQALLTAREMKKNKRTCMQQPNPAASGGFGFLLVHRGAAVL